MISLSPSGVNLMDECPKCFWREHHGDPRPRQIFPSITNGIDGLLKSEFDLYRAGANTVSPGLPEGYVPFPDQMFVDRLRARDGGLWWQDGDYRMHGLLDDLLLYGDGVGAQMALIDFKSKGKAPEQRDTRWYTGQLNLYAFLMHYNAYPVHKEAVLLYVYPNISDGGLKLTTTALSIDVAPEKGLALLKRAIQILDGDMPHASGSCTYCKYRDGGKRE